MSVPICVQSMLSPPSRRRGLKYHMLFLEVQKTRVASLAEAWIEILKDPDSFQTKHVASLAEAWIEIR